MADNYSDRLLEDGSVLLNLKNLFVQEKTDDNLYMVLGCLSRASVLVPMNADMSEADRQQLAEAQPGDTLQSSGSMHFRSDILQSPSGAFYLPVFSNESQIPEGYRSKFTFVSLPVLRCIEALDQAPKLSGIILDAFTVPMEITRDLTKVIRMIPLAESKAS